MTQNLSKIFKNLPEIEPSANLEWNIMKSIRLAEQKKLKNRLYFIQLGFAVSIAALVLAVLEFGQTILKSDFWNFIQLIFTDYKVVFLAWGDYAYSLMETFPTIEISLLLIPILGLLICFYYYFNSGNRNHYKHI
ncbi:MAG: hypothetical protein NTZ97_01825 [Candidatus Moranbacteria bacterium]|nr:hypothetical protein [Candidatus Moranbacteria bacterium]